MTKCRQLFQLTAKPKETALGSATWTLTPRDWRDCAGAESLANPGGSSASSEASSKVAGDFLSARSLRPNLNRPVKPQTCGTSACSQGQVRVPARLYGSLTFLSTRLDAQSQATQGTAPGPQQPRQSVGLLTGHCLPGLRTAAEIKRQKTRRQEGDTLGAIFLLLLEGHRQSPRRGRGRRPRAHGARSLVGPDSRGSGVFPDTRSPGDRGAGPSGLCHTQLSPTLNPQLLPPPPRPPSLSVFGCCSQDGRPSYSRRRFSSRSRWTRSFFIIIIIFFWLLSSVSFSACKGDEKRSQESCAVHGSRGPRRGRRGSASGSAPWVSSGGSRGSGWSGGSWSSGGGRGLGLL